MKETVKLITLNCIKITTAYQLKQKIQYVQTQGSKYLPNGNTDVLTTAHDGSVILCCFVDCKFNYNQYCTCRFIQVNELPYFLSVCCIILFLTRQILIWPINKFKKLQYATRVLIVNKLLDQYKEKQYIQSCARLLRLKRLLN